MKRFGVLLVAIGCALLAFAAYSYFRRSRELISPVPEGSGVKVIYITPGQNN